MNMTWNTFPHAPAQMEVMTCQSQKHDGLDIPASSFQMLWIRDDENLAQSIIVRGWFTCIQCNIEMHESWQRESITRTEKKM